MTEHPSKSAGLDLDAAERRLWEAWCGDLSNIIAELRAARTREQRVRDLCDNFDPHHDNDNERVVLVRRVRAIFDDGGPR